MSVMTLQVQTPRTETESFIEFMEDALKIAKECWRNRHKIAVPAATVASNQTKSTETTIQEPKEEVKALPPEFHLFDLSRHELKKMQDLRAKHPFKFIYGAQAPDGSFLCGAAATMQIPNRLMRQGSKVVCLK